MVLKKLDKQSLKYLGIIIILAILVGIGLFYFLKIRIQDLPKAVEGPPVDPMKQIIRSLTAPEGQAEPVGQEVLDSLSAPEGKSKPVPQEVIDSLTAPSN